MRLIASLILVLIASNSYANCEIQNILGEKKISEIINQEKKTTPLEYLHVEGVFPYNEKYKESMQGIKDLQVMYYNALVWKNNPKLTINFNKSKNDLLNWVKIYKPTYNPIDESNFSYLFDTYGILKNNLKEDDIRSINLFLTKWALGYNLRMEKTLGKNYKYDNWNSHRVKILTMIAYTVNDEKLKEIAKKQFQIQVTNNISNSGEVFDFKYRNALHYVVVDLQQLVDAARISEKYNDDWYRWKAPNGASLEKAIQWLTPYIKGDKQHEEFENSKIQFDIIRSKGGVKGFSGKFEPKSASKLLWSVTDLDPKYLPLAKSVAQTKSYDLSICW